MWILDEICKQNEQIAQSKAFFYPSYYEGTANFWEAGSFNFTDHSAQKSIYN